MLEADVLVVGGGPAGAWTAHLLAVRGFRVLLWDRTAFPRDKPCGEFVSPGAVRLMLEGGAGPALDALRPARLHGARIVTHRGESFTGGFADGDGTGLSLRRLHLDAALLDFARRTGVCVEEGTTFRSFRWEDGACFVEGRRAGEPVLARCRVLVGADGGHSAVARAMGVVRPFRWLQKVAFVAHARGIEGAADLVEMHAGSSGCVGIGPGPEGTANVTVVVTPSEARRAGKDVPGYVRRAVEAYPGLGGRFDRAEWDAQILRTGTFGHTTRRAVADGVLLVGDSATFVDPFTGEGVYFALRGAEMAAERIEAALHSGAATVEALAPYEQDRCVEFRKKYLLCGIVERVVSHPWALHVMACRLRAKPHLADELIRATGDILRPERILSAPFWARLLT